jgi:hypothetical protein
MVNNPRNADRTRMQIASVIDHAEARGLFMAITRQTGGGGLKELLPVRQKLSRGHHAAVGIENCLQVIAAAHIQLNVCPCGRIHLPHGRQER